MQRVILVKIPVSYVKWNHELNEGGFDGRTNRNHVHSIRIPHFYKGFHMIFHIICKVTLARFLSDNGIEKGVYEL